MMALVTIELALTHPAVRRDVLTPLWQGGVALIGLLLLLLFSKAQVKLKNDHDRTLSKAV